MWTCTEEVASHDLCSLLPVLPSQLPLAGHRAVLFIDCKSIVELCILAVCKVVFSLFLLVPKDSAGTHKFVGAFLFHGACD